MIIIPLTGQISWKNPPYLTISLILINCLVFFLFQMSDDRRQMEAARFYVQSDLPGLEIPAYRDYLQDQSTVPPPPAPDLSDEEELYGYAMRIMADASFLRKLRSGEIITESDDHYEKWRRLRAEYDNRLSDIVSYRFGFKPGLPDEVSFFTHMFLHGGFMHLLGNMVFLWLAGCLVETGMRRYFFLPAYILTGCSSVGLFWAFNLNSGIPLVGASGAISGLMGILATLYGRNRIRVFYSLGIYFNYIKTPAILLLPVWIGKELFAIYWGGPSNVAYLAHVGGFIGGGLIGLVSRHLLHIENAAAIEEPPEDPTPVYIEQALKAAGELKIEEALAILDNALAEAPDNPAIIHSKYKIAKMKPETRVFHATAVNLLKIYSSSPEHYQQAGELFSDYLKTAGRPRLPLRLYVRLASVFISLGDTDKAEKIIAMFLKKKSDVPELPVILLKLGRAFKAAGNQGKYEKCRRLLVSRFPDSREALMLDRSE